MMRQLWPIVCVDKVQRTEDNEYNTAIECDDRGRHPGDFIGGE